MTRMPLATASLLALAISLAGCGDDKQEAAAPQTSAPAAATASSAAAGKVEDCLLYTSPSPRDKRQSRMPSSA